MIRFKGTHFPKEVMLMAIRWYLAYPLSYRHVEELLQERGISVDHATVQRWVVKYAPLLERKLRAIQKPTLKSWRMDETYIKIRGQWCYYYRAVDKEGKTVDFYLSQKRDLIAAKRFLLKAIESEGVPEKVNIDKSGANLAALKSINRRVPKEQKILIRQIKYRNNIVEQDPRAIKRLTRPMLGFKSFESAAATLAGIELCHKLRKGQSKLGSHLSAAEQFYALAA
jgi:putative transposase